MCLYLNNSAHVFDCSSSKKIFSRQQVGAWRWTLVSWSSRVDLCLRIKLRRSGCRIFRSVQGTIIEKIIASEKYIRGQYLVWARNYDFSRVHKYMHMHMHGSIESTYWHYTNNHVRTSIISRVSLKFIAISYSAMISDLINSIPSTLYICTCFIFKSYVIPPC